MLTVMELISFPLFRNFRLVSGYSGLYNQIKGTGIFEWESSSDVEKNFEKGEFIITTLSMSRGDKELAESSIRMLIDNGVSAVAVKDIYYHEISTELKAYSDERRVPVFFFSETFFDDIIFTIKNVLITQSRNFTSDEQLESLLNGGHSPDHQKKTAREINPFFHSCIICCYGSMKKNSQWQRELNAPHLNPEEDVYSILEYQRGLLLIYTAKDPSTGLIGLDERLQSFLEKSGLRKHLHRMGTGSPAKGLENLGTAIREALYAHTSCLMTQSDCLRFRDSGLDQVLLPMADSFWTQKYYQDLLLKIKDYDEHHGAKLLETLQTFIGNGGDMKLTAQKMFQHSNTIRYRIDKIRKLLELDEGSGSFAQLYVFVRLHEIYTNQESI